jgi:hypothetical protein
MKLKERKIPMNKALIGRLESERKKQRYQPEKNLERKKVIVILTELKEFFPTVCKFFIFRTIK